MVCRDVWYVNASALWLVPIKHAMEYGVFKRLMLVIRQSMRSPAPFESIDKVIVPNVKLTSDFNRQLKFLCSKSTVLPGHTMEDVGNAIEVILPMALATVPNGRYVTILDVQTPNRKLFTQCTHAA